MKNKKETLTEKCNRQIEAIAKHEQALKSLQDQDAHIRGQFTKVLNSPNRLGGDYWGNQSQQRTLSWEEIFFQVGSISARLFNEEIRRDISDLQKTVNQSKDECVTH